MQAARRLFTRQAKSHPDEVKQLLLNGVRAYLGADYDVSKHFEPRYKPWSQRIAFVPDGDLFKAVASGKASVVTDHIDRFTETGIALKSGEALAADIIVTATGFNLCPLGDVAFTVDGKAFDWGNSVGYRSAMFTGAPNMVWVCGYFRASWTLRTELLADFTCGLLNHMDMTGHKTAEVQLCDEDRDMPISSWADTNDFNPGYILRGGHLMPKRGTKPEWQISQDYWAEKDHFKTVDYGDAAFVYQ